jgi:hypothetical protein
LLLNVSEVVVPRALAGTYIAEYERLRAMPAMHVAARRSSSSGRPRVKLLIMGRPRSKHCHRQAHTAHDQGLAEKMEREVAHEGRVCVLFEEPLVAAGQNLVVIPGESGPCSPARSWRHGGTPDRGPIRTPSATPSR